MLQGLEKREAPLLAYLVAHQVKTESRAAFAGALERSVWDNRCVSTTP